MKMAIEEPIGPCPCKGTLCNNGFGWIMGKMSDLRGGCPSRKHNVAICSEFPEDLMEWDAAMKRFLNSEGARGGADDIQNTDRAMKASERAMERLKDDVWREEYS